MKRRFVTLDVFTDRPFAGNPLAVVLDAEGLADVAMQAIAREFNLSETVFVLPPRDAAHRACVRIFTPKRELPFAGHPIVGTAVLLARLDGGSNARAVLLEAKIGLVPCRVRPAAAHGHAFFDLPALPAEVGAPPTADALAAALGLAAGDIGCAAFTPCCWSAGLAFTFVPVKNLDAVRRAAPDLAQIAATFGAPERQAIYVFTDRAAEPGHDYHARMFAPGLGVVEDPATGSAAAAFAGVLARYAGLKDGTHKISIEQGYEMGRPSVIHLGLTLAASTLTAASVSGDAVVVAEGAIEA